MIAVDERVAVVEARVEEQRMRTDDIRDAVHRLEDRMDRRFAGIEARLDTLNRMFWGLLVAVATSAAATIASLVAALIRR